MLRKSIEQELIFAGGNEFMYFAIIPWQVLQWQIAWSLYCAPFQPWFSYCSPGKVIMYTGEQLQGHNQQPKIGNSQLLTVQCSYSITASVCIVALFICGYSFGSCHHKAIPTADNKLVSIALDFRGPLLPSSGYGAAIDHGKSSSSIPWDPGGVAWWRLEGKPPFEDGGMLIATLPFTVGPVHRWAHWHWVGLGQRHEGEGL
jgi:hypothetical protein